MSAERLKVSASMLNNRCDPDSLGFETTDEIAPLAEMIGQERAVSALELALSIEDPGFNLFISGLPGTGRNTALRDHVERLARRRPIPPDLGVCAQLSRSFATSTHQSAVRPDAGIGGRHGRIG